MAHFAVPETSDVFKKLDKKVVRQIRKQLQSYANAFEAALKRSLALAVDQSHADATRFFAAFANGLSRMPSDLQASNFQRTTTRIYWIMLLGWRSVPAAEKRARTAARPVSPFRHPCRRRRKVSKNLSAIGLEFWAAWPASALLSQAALF